MTNQSNNFIIICNECHSSNTEIEVNVGVNEVTNEHTTTETFISCNHCGHVEWYKATGYNEYIKGKGALEW